MKIRLYIVNCLGDMRENVHCITLFDAASKLTYQKCSTHSVNAATTNLSTNQCIQYIKYNIYVMMKPTLADIDTFRYCTDAKLLRIYSIYKRPCSNSVKKCNMWIN